MVNIMLRSLFIATILSLSSASLAAPVYGSGRITGIYVAPSDNFSFRISIDGPFSGTCVNNFAYVLKSSGNYDAYVAVLTSAAAMGKQIQVWANQDMTGFCQIQDISVSM